MTAKRYPIRSSQFKKDYKRCVRRHGPGAKEDLAAVVRAPLEGVRLDERHRDHRLTSWSPPARECHIRPDLLLVCRLSDNAVELVRFGSHSYIF